MEYSVGLQIENGILKGLGSCADKNLVIPEGVVEIYEEAFWIMVKGRRISPTTFLKTIFKIFQIFIFTNTKNIPLRSTKSVFL